MKRQNAEFTVASFVVAAIGALVEWSHKFLLWGPPLCGIELLEIVGVVGCVWLLVRGVRVLIREPEVGWRARGVPLVAVGVGLLYLWFVAIPLGERLLILFRLFVWPHH
jgi:hypothetical protein